MPVLEEDMKQKWCPLACVVVSQPDFASGNRFDKDDFLNGQTKCLGSDCAWWKSTSDTHGFCMKVGDPEPEPTTGLEQAIEIAEADTEAARQRLSKAFVALDSQLRESRGFKEPLSQPETPDPASIDKRVGQVWELDTGEHVELLEEIRPNCWATKLDNGAEEFALTSDLTRLISEASDGE